MTFRFNKDWTLRYIQFGIEGIFPVLAASTQPLRLWKWTFFPTSPGAFITKEREGERENQSQVLRFWLVAPTTMTNNQTNKQTTSSLTIMSILSAVCNQTRTCNRHYRFLEHAPAGIIYERHTKIFHSLYVACSHCFVMNLTSQRRHHRHSLLHSSIFSSAKITQQC